MRLGFHLSIAGSLRRAVYQAQVLGCQALQIFVQNPRGWKWRPVAPAAIRDFSQARLYSGPAESLNLRGRHRAPFPAPGVLDKDLEGLAAQNLSLFDRPAQRTGNGKMEP